MSYRIDRPNYSVMMIDLSQAGSSEINQSAQRLSVTRAERAGSIAPDAIVEVALGAQTEDYIPLSHGGHIIARTERYYLRWPAQPGVKIYITISQYGSAEGGLIVQAPPTASLTVQDGTAWQVTDAGTAAALNTVAAASVDRVGSSSYAGTLVSMTTLVNPAANAGGIILRTFSGAYGLVYAGTAPPASVTSGTAILGNQVSTGPVPSWVGALKIPAGQGLYLGTAYGGGYIALTWDMI